MDDMSTSSSSRAPRRGRGRRPSAEVRREVLAATAELLFTDGVRAITFDRVATVAGASKTTLYKWWRTPEALAVDAYFERVEQALSFPDTGDIERDVRSQLRAFARLMTLEPAGRAVRELIGAGQSDPELRAAFAASYAKPRRAEAVRAFERARQRGQIRSDARLDVLVDQLWGGCYHRLLLMDETLDDELIDALVANAFHGAAPRE
jgi:AcrR family transcriptional regulator